MKQNILKFFLILFLIGFLIANHTTLLNTKTISRYLKLNELDTLMATELNKIRAVTGQNIRNIEAEALEESPMLINPNDGPDLTSIRNEDDDGIELFSTQAEYTLHLFYTMSCPHSQAILPIWYRIRNALPRNCSHKEVDCSKLEHRPTCSKFKISGVPTIILVKKENDDIQNIEYSGDNSFNDIKQFLRTNNVVVNAFEDVGHSKSEHLNVESFQNINIDVPDTSIDDRLQRNQESNCPSVSYDKNMDRSQDKYYFQLFNPQGQYGYSKGGVGEPLDKFHAAYNAVDTYLSTLPDPELINACATKNKKMIREFELCDEKKLDDILSYPRLVETGKANERMEHINYSNNNRVVNAIKNACSIKNS